MDGPHDEQLIDYLRFLRRKRDSAIAEVVAEFNDAKETRLFEDNYSVDEVVQVLDGIVTNVRTVMKRDLQNAGFSSVLLLKQAFEQAEERGIPLSTDVNATEDRNLLDYIAQWDQDIHGGSGAAPPPMRARATMNSRPAARALPVIGQTQDPKLVADLQSARDDNAELQERFSRLQVQTTAALRDKSAMQAQLDSLAHSAPMEAVDAAEVASLRAQVAELQAELDGAHAPPQAGGSGVDSLMQELHSLQEVNSQLAADLDASRAEASARVERSQQFVNLRQMLAKKNALVRNLRGVLQDNGIHVDDVDAQDD